MQIGQCYKTIKGLLAEGGNIEHCDQLTNDLCSIWNGFLTQQPGTALSSFAGQSGDQSNPQWQLLNDLHKEINNAGNTVSRDFLSSLNTMRAEQIDLKQFFIHWACSCDSAYSELVRSEPYAKAIGQFVNALLRSADLAWKDTTQVDPRENQ